MAVSSRREGADVKRIATLISVFLLGCPGEIPAPRTVPIVNDGSGRPEVTEFVEVHVVPLARRKVR